MPALTATTHTTSGAFYWRLLQIAIPTLWPRVRSHFDRIGNLQISGSSDSHDLIMHRLDDISVLLVARGIRVIGSTESSVLLPIELSQEPGASTSCIDLNGRLEATLSAPSLTPSTAPAGQAISYTESTLRELGDVILALRSSNLSPLLEKFLGLQYLDASPSGTWTQLDQDSQQLEFDILFGLPGQRFANAVLVLLRICTYFGVPLRLTDFRDLVATQLVDVDTRRDFAAFDKHCTTLDKAMITLCVCSENTWNHFLFLDVFASER
ncbi:hypothetical protein M427DRAFT_75460, partial [Gonapodya prolifera JEL478]